MFGGGSGGEVGLGVVAAAGRATRDAGDTRGFGEVETGVTALALETLEHLSLDELRLPSRCHGRAVLYIWFHQI